MVKNIKRVSFILGLFFMAVGVYMFVLMDFTTEIVENVMRDGLGLAMVALDQANSIERFFYHLGAWLPFAQGGTHVLSISYILLRMADVFLLVLALSFLFYGIFGPSDEEEMEEAINENS